MRRVLLKIIHILDGTPAVYGKRQRGQSVVELALVTPILIFMFAGLVEIGWFANNYLNLLDITRAGARRAATFTDLYSPLEWDNQNSLVPNSMLEPQYHTTQNPTGQNGTDTTRGLRRQFNPTTGQCINTDEMVDEGFYNNVVCIMLRSMPPLMLRDNDEDDIIVSGFGLVRVDPTRNRPNIPSPDIPWLGPNRPLRNADGSPSDLPQVVVAGRYPTNANECDVAQNTPGIFTIQPREPRDPFDFNENGRIDVTSLTLAPNNNPLEIVNEYSEIWVPTKQYGYDPVATNVQDAEKQVGFSWFGNREIPGTGCIGSSWRMADIERLLNLPGYGLNDAETRRLLPGQGVVLVEMFWQHELLLNLPVFTYLLQFGEEPVINVWSAFPLPSVEPFIAFP
jgi:hypothetical protein